MKIVFVNALLILCVYSNSAFSVKQISSAELEQRDPVLSSSEAIALAKTFLVKEHNVKITHYRLAHLSFQYFNQWESNEAIYAGEWSIGFDTVHSSPPGSKLLVIISNSKKPAIKLIPDM